MPKTPALFPEEENYFALLSGLKKRIQSAQIKAVLAVNRELILLYWQIGREILARQQAEGWGGKVIERLAQDLKREFPDMKGFSRSNLMYMRAFAEAWPDEQFVHQAGGQIPWKHNCVILEKVKDPTERLWYIQQTVENGWSRNVLVLQIESGLFQRQGGAITNFERTLPSPQSDLVQQLIKDPYHLEFLPLGKKFQERELENALVAHIRDFLMELGVGFAFVGSQYYLNIGGEDFYLDLLFYHLELRCFIIIDLKMGEFKAEYSGKMNLYVSAVDDLLRKKHDNPTIGIILCKSKNKTIAEYALRNVNTPIAVSTHKLPKQLQESLPTAEQLEMELEAAVKELGDDQPDEP
ncbi:PDDEXK nuclease domain-containing protein [Nodosilinea sp. AN01ver1]|uniref:PDDEXK nuclease domain-containing protein n=1 Tax=Nodosilinea sp. AN01ver1 TaxID=3423362 RepID=UPI003D3115B2